MLKSIDAPIQYLKGVGPKRAEFFKQAGIATVEDLLYFFPKRYEDRRNFFRICDLQEGVWATIKARVLSRSQAGSFRRKGFTITRALVSDDSGSILCVWFNQPYLKEYLKIGQLLIISGRVERYAGSLQIGVPEFELISDEEDSSQIKGLVPVYSLPEGMTQRYFRQLVKSSLDVYLPRIKDHLSFDIRTRNNLLNLARSLRAIHFPDDLEIQKEAYKRLSFDDFFIFQLPLALRKNRRHNKPGIAHPGNSGLIDDFVRSLPFRLTQAQEKVISEIRADMGKQQPMQRLLQGDVGSGKTIVSVIASLLAISGGYQAAFMAPTEILANQHYQKLISQQKQIRIRLLTGSLIKKEKEKIYREIKEGQVDLIIGTHALLETSVEFHKLGLVVIDEQHKFGVGQRALLPGKGRNPDVLIMTATPIPRTLAITLYGDLDISVIDELPAGRGGVKTLSFSADERSKAYLLAREQLKLGRQAYIIYPVIEESYVLDMAGAKKMYAQLKTGEFKGFKLGLIHGKLDNKTQNEVMRKFREKELDVLLATTILEVGIDIPNASCMVIEHAERFGLATLHQLRGRVGRGPYESSCILLSAASNIDAEERIKAMIRHNNGFRIAEEDLRIRGPGEFFGRRQHGLTELKIANPLTQMQLLKKAREEAIRVISADAYLQQRQNLAIKEVLLRRFPEYEKLMVVG